MDRQQYMREKYLPGVYKLGKVTNLFGIFLCFIPLIYLASLFGLPTLSVLIPSLLSVWATFIIPQFTQLIQFFPILGAAGSYMSNLSGNISNHRVPCAIAAEAAAEVEPGTPECEICATIGVAVSTMSNILFITIGILGAAALFSNLPPAITTAMGFLLPALMAGIVVMVAWESLILVPIAVALYFLLKVWIGGLLPGIVNFAQLGVIIGTIAISMWFYNRKQGKEPTIKS